MIDLQENQYLVCRILPDGCTASSLIVNAESSEAAIQKAKDIWEWLFFETPLPYHTVYLGEATI